MLRRNQKVELLRKVPLFARCSKRELAEIATLADEIDLRAGKELIREGARGREFFVLLEGQADVLKNGKRINEPYVQPNRRDARTINPIKIKPGNYFMMGDNRSSSCDSRAWGTVPKKSLIGKVFATYWPPGRITSP